MVSVLFVISSIATTNEKISATKENETSDVPSSGATQDDPINPDPAKELCILSAKIAVYE